MSNARHICSACKRGFMHLQELVQHECFQAMPASLGEAAAALRASLTDKERAVLDQRFPRKVVRIEPQAQPEMPAQEHDQQEHEQHEADGVADAVADGRTDERKHEPHDQHEQQDIDDGHARERTPSERPIIYPCGCSHLKVDLDRCSHYLPGGAPRKPRTVVEQFVDSCLRSASDSLPPFTPHVVVLALPGRQATTAEEWGTSTVFSISNRPPAEARALLQQAIDAIDARDGKSRHVEHVRTINYSHARRGTMIACFCPQPGSLKACECMAEIAQKPYSAEAVCPCFCHLPRSGP